MIFHIATWNMPAEPVPSCLSRATGPEDVGWGYLKKMGLPLITHNLLWSIRPFGCRDLHDSAIFTHPSMENLTIYIYIYMISIWINIYFTNIHGDLDRCHSRPGQLGNNLPRSPRWPLRCRGSAQPCSKSLLVDDNRDLIGAYILCIYIYTQYNQSCKKHV